MAAGTLPGGDAFPGLTLKAFAHFRIVAGALTLMSSRNVASVVRNGAGDTTVNFTVALTTAFYILDYASNAPSQILTARFQSQAVGNGRVVWENPALALVDPDAAYVAFYE